MSEKFEMRPRFNLESQLSPKEVVEKLKSILSAEESEVTGWVYDRSAQVKVAKDQNIWSPQLTVYAEEIENGTELRCVIGPNSTVWTTIIFFYAIIGMGALIGSIWGLSQMTLGQSPWAFGFLPIALILIGGVYMGAKVGQKLSARQMKILRELVGDLVRSKSK